MSRGRGLRVLVFVLRAILLLALAVATAPLYLPAIGGRLTGERLERARRSPNYRDGEMQNTLPTSTLMAGSFWKMLRETFFGHEERSPEMPMPIARPDPLAPAEPLRLTWLGHATVLIEIDGQRVLTDPMFAERVSPVSFVGPRRFHPTPLALEELPEIDVVVISHDHYDHLDHGAILELARGGCVFIVPLGVGTHFDRWGVPPARVFEHDWWEHTTVGDLTFTAAPARHFSGRFPGRENHTLWASWAIVGPKSRVYFSGDTGYAPFFTEIGQRLGPFDATLIKIGAYGTSWPDIHIDPEQGVKVHREVRGGLLLPIHWGTFNLAIHDWYEPAERVLAAAREAGVTVALPVPGQSVVPSRPPPVETWWRRD